MYELDQRAELLEIIVNQHKDIYGFKPRGDAFARYAAMTYEQLVKVADEFEIAVVAAINEDKERENRAVVKFEQLIVDTIELGAKDRQTAIDWILQAEDVDDLGYLEYKFGLPYNYFKRTA